MSTPQNRDSNVTPGGRLRCYGCFRPISHCFCQAIPRIDNRTEVLIIQHRRERFHPFNTARMVSRALIHSRIICDRVVELSRDRLPFGSRTGLLYPGRNAIPINRLTEEQRPDQLVVIDGTWHQARQIMRDVPQLRELPQFKIQPDQPGQFRIRREPDETSLSTVEATVAALGVLEPDIQGLDQLIAAFNTMVESQLAHPKSQYGWRRNAKRHGTPFNIPFSLIREFDRIVVAYGESRGRERDAGGQENPAVRKPIYWVAERLCTAENFNAAILDDPSPISETILRHLELDRQHFDNALSTDEFRQAWRDFLKPGDTLLVYDQSTIRLLQQANADFAASLIMKSVDLNHGCRNGPLYEMVERLGIVIGEPRLPGRAGKRLARAIALAKYLHHLGNQNIEGR